MSDQRFPIGKFNAKTNLNETEVKEAIEGIRCTPRWLRATLEGLTPVQIDTPYRPDGWTVRQVVHHLADSHLNGYLRFKFAMTEDEPLVKPYDEKRWAELEDARSLDPEVSLQLLDSLHLRWTTMLDSFEPKDFNRGLNHPEWGRQRLEMFLQLYDWHGRHHTAHITSLRERLGW
jgi:hypothetical protein